MVSASLLHAKRMSHIGWRSDVARHLALDTSCLSANEPLASPREPSRLSCATGCMTPVCQLLCDTSTSPRAADVPRGRLRLLGVKSLAQ
jgi:hypothetical protein